MQKLLIVGGGYIASQAKDFFTEKKWEVVVVDFPEVDITKINSVREVLNSHSPSIVLNAAAFTNTNAAEKADQQDMVFAVNVSGVANLALASREHSAKLVHISTGMMFDAPTPPSGWTEDDAPAPTGYYSLTKYWADCLLLGRAQEDNILVTRIHTPISSVDNPKNLLTKLRSFGKVIDDAASLTVVDDYFMALFHLLTTDQTGLFNIVNSGTLSLHGITEKLFDAGLREAPAEKSSLAELNETLRATPGNAHQPLSILSNKKLADAGFAMPDAATRIDEIISRLTK